VGTDPAEADQWPLWELEVLAEADQLPFWEPEVLAEAVQQLSF
jgi:hypothetical protein